MNRDSIIENIIEVEGGFTDDASDSGGATKYGITESVAREHGFRGDMWELSRDFAKDIYIHDYWNRLSLDDVIREAPNVAEELMDTGVNQGVGRAAEFFQRALNILNNRGIDYDDIAVDGGIGPRTMIAWQAYMARRSNWEGATVMCRVLNCLQGAFYVDLAERREKDEKFVYGWFLNRVR